jgi:CheY-like chemotaxis protein
MKPSEITVLLVEDDSIDVMNVQRAFSKNNITYPLHIAQNGIEALNLLRGTNGKPKMPTPKVILLDINMPKMNGLEFLKELRNDTDLKNLIVFILTTSNDEQDKFEAFNHHVAGYILKPLSFEKFVNAISILNNYWKICEIPESKEKTVNL